MTLNYEDLEYINVLGKRRSLGILRSAILEPGDWRDISKVMYAIFIKIEWGETETPDNDQYSMTI